MTSGLRSAGWRVILPGAAQWRWGQRERASVFFGSFAAASFVGLMAWGTRAGAASLAFAFLAHVAATADVIRQGSFPGFGRWVPTTAASLSLGLGCYAPMVALGAALAWPAPRSSTGPEGFLVNRWAYRESSPAAGQHIWYGTADERGPTVGQVLAVGGQGVVWGDGRLSVGGRVIPWTPPTSAPPPRRLAFTVPDDHLLVALGMGSDASGTAGFEVVARDRVEGRAWARYYPFWQRRLLL